MIALRLLLIVSLCTSLGACVSRSVKSTSVPRLESSSTEVSEALLLDVAVAIFNPGLDDYDEDERVYPEVRKAEARYMPTLLAEALQDSGAWGSVRVVPNSAQITDLLVNGEIIYSDGEELQLHIHAVDSRGFVWLDEEYQSNASRYAYQGTTRSSYDPFQAVYHTIANDLLNTGRPAR